MKRIKADWNDVVLVCRKCSKKLKGGFGPDGDDTLAKALRQEIARSDGGKPRKPKRRGTHIAIIEVGCLDVCPKNAVVTINASTPGEWVLVPRGTDAADVLGRLQLKGGEA